jgi:hypothetical protein
MAVKDAASLPLFLFWRGVGKVQPSVGAELAIAASLKMRGVRVEHILCDGALSGCFTRTAEQNIPIQRWREACSGCIANGREMTRRFGIAPHSHSEFLTESLIKELAERSSAVSYADIRNHRYREVPVGKYAASSTLRYFKGRSLNGQGEPILRHYLFSAIVVAEVAWRALDELQPTRLYMQHGTYVDWGPAFDVAMMKGIPVTVWEWAFLNKHIFLGTAREDNRLCFHFITDETWRRLAAQPLTGRQRQGLLRFMTDRVTNARDLMPINRVAPRDPHDVQRQLGLSGTKPVWAVFSHLDWDSTFDIYMSSFEHSLEMMLETVRVIAETPDVDWVIKIHPAEKIAGTLVSTKKVIEERFPKLPDNIKIIPAETDINTYSLLPLLSGGITIFGTVAMELALIGKPTLVAGTAHYSDRGFTRNLTGREEFLNGLRQAAQIGSLLPEQVELAERYAHTFFIRKQLPIKALNMDLRQWSESDFAKLKPGYDPALDMVCDRLVDGGEFMLDDATLGCSLYA